MRTDVSVILEDKLGKLLLQKRENKKSVRHPGYWGLFGGKVENSETPEQAVHREILEELDLNLKETVLLKAYAFEEKRVDLLYKPKNPIQPTKISLMEGETFKWFSKEEVLNLKKLVPYDNVMLTEYLRDQTP